MSLLLRQQGCQLLAYPSAFTVPTGKAHWEVLLKARAIESQCFVIAAAQCGQHHLKRRSFGHSCIIDPWGTVLASLAEEECAIASTQIDLTFLEKIRNELPVYFHKRLDVYELIEKN
jgi:predicted amidohydrolase